jgi:hypothetical protein
MVSKGITLNILMKEARVKTSGATNAPLVFQSLPATEVIVLESEVPKLVNAVAIVTPRTPAMMAYSRAVTPRRSWRKLAKRVRKRIMGYTLIGGHRWLLEACQTKVGRWLL